MRKFRVPVLILSLFTSLFLWVLNPILNYLSYKKYDDISFWSDIYKYRVLGIFEDWTLFKELDAYVKINATLGMLFQYSVVVISIFIVIDFLSSRNQPSEFKGDSSEPLPMTPHIPPGILD